MKVLMMAKTLFCCCAGLLLIKFIAGCSHSAVRPQRRAAAGMPNVSSELAAKQIHPSYLPATKGPGGKRKPSVTWKRSSLTSNLTSLTVGDRRSIPLKAMQADVTIEAFRARVFLDLHYYNNRQSRLEGIFKIRLPDGASPFYLAFGATSYRARQVTMGDLKPLRMNNDRMMTWTGKGYKPVASSGWQSVKEALMVPREKAAFAYQETVVRRVDPALMEWEGAGVFSARVFPLSRGAMHRIVIGYDVDLSRVAQGWEFAMPLPKKPPVCKVSLSVADMPGTTVEMPKEGKPFHADFSTQASIINPESDAIRVLLRQTGNSAITSADAAIGKCWAAQVSPKIPHAGEIAGNSTAVYLLDTSLSSAPTSFSVYVDFLTKHLEENRGQIREFAVVSFDIRQRWWRTRLSSNTAEEVSKLRSYLEETVLQGATDLTSALRIAQEQSWLGKKYDLFLLSDGQATWGNRARTAMVSSLSHRLFAYTVSSVKNSTLASLAHSKGGAVISLSAQPLRKAAGCHRRHGWELVSVACDKSGDILVAGNPGELFPGQHCKLVGRGEIAADAEIVFTLKCGNNVRQVSTSVSAVIEGKLASRVYGEVALSFLDRYRPFSDREVEAYGCHFKIVGPRCSLVMLESQADYDRFGIGHSRYQKAVSNIALKQTLTRARQKSDRLRRDPAQRIRDWLVKLEGTPGLRFTGGKALLELVNSMPSASFAVMPEKLIAEEEGRFGTSYYRDCAKGTAERRTINRLVSRLKSNSVNALTALSSLNEKSPSDQQLLRATAFHAMSWGYWKHAYHLMDRAYDTRPFEPTGLRAMALCLTEAGMADLAVVHYEVALGTTWDRRFDKVLDVLRYDYLRLLRQIERRELSTALGAFTRKRQRELAGTLKVGRVPLLASLMWNTDRTDVDICVDEPGARNVSGWRSGRGRVISRVRRGYGPEMYLLADESRGRFNVFARYSSEDWARTESASQVLVAIHHNWGTAQEKTEYKTALLESGRENPLLKKLVTFKSGISCARLGSVLFE